MATKTKYIGTYHAYGYEVLHHTDHGYEQDYQAGNCRWDSTQVLTPDGSNGVLDLATIREHCESTGKEIAAEHGGEWAGCQYDTDSENSVLEVLERDIL